MGKDININNIIEARGLVKRYADVVALDELDPSVPEGTIVGLLGPNGAGSDVLFTLARFPNQGDQEWTEGVQSMNRELENLKARHES